MPDTDDVLTGTPSAGSVTLKRCKNGIVQLVGTTPTVTTETVATVKEGYRPLGDIVGNIYTASSNDLSKKVRIRVTTGGTLRFATDSNLNAGAYYSIIYQI